MLDDRNITPDPDSRPQLWSHRDNARSWLAFLGGHAGTDNLPFTSAPGRMTIEQAQGLPSTYLDNGDKDIFRDECLDYCAKLAKAGVEIELHVLPGMGHAFDWSYTGKPAVQAVVRARYRAICSI
jgi:acetyl esterase/lipase